MANVRILITDGMAKNGLEILKAQAGFELDVHENTPADELKKIIGSYDCIVIRSATTLTKELVEAASTMKLIVRAGAGVDNIDVKTATDRKIPVMNTAAANSLAAAEQTIALIFATLRQIPQSAASLRAQKWERDKFKGYEVTGKTLGIVGFGNIGRIVAEKAVGLGMNVLAYDPVVTSLASLGGKLSKMDESIRLTNNVDEVFEKADIVSLHVPKTDKTANMVNAERLKKMKDGSFLINCARGGVVNEKDVIEALNSGKLAGAAFDVFQKEPPTFPDPLIEHPKAVCVPHLGASTHEAQKRVASTAASQIIGFFTRGDRTGVIN